MTVVGKWIPEFIWGSPKDEKLTACSSSGFDLSLLTQYITSTYGEVTDKNREEVYAKCTKAIQVGKLGLALHLQDTVLAVMKEKQKDYQSLLMDIYIFYKMNEFFENPTLYDYLETPIESSLTNRQAMTGLIEKAKETYGGSLSITVDVEIICLYKVVKQLLCQCKVTKLSKEIVLPPTLSDNLLTNSTYRYSKLHFPIKSLYDQCQEKLKKIEAKKAGVVKS